MPTLPKHPVHPAAVSQRRPAPLIGLLVALVCNLASGAAPAAGSTDTTAVRGAPADGAGVGVPDPQPLYRYTDAQGRTVYGNRPPPGVPARLLPYVPSPPQRPLAPVTTRPPAPGHLPLAHPQAPAPPGTSQQQVLVEQLAKQVEALQTARNALKEGEAVRNGDERNYQRYLDRIQGLRDAVTRQEGVVEALQGQLRLLGGGGLVE